jgi:hypothetical protein
MAVVAMAAADTAAGLPMAVADISGAADTAADITAVDITANIAGADGAAGTTRAPR